MFENILLTIKLNHRANKVQGVLLRNYLLSVSLEDIMQVISKHSLVDNEHELALWYLAFRVARIDLVEPKTYVEVKNYIRVAKKAASLGYIEDKRCGDLLFALIKEKLNINSSDIQEE